MNETTKIAAKTQKMVQCPRCDGTGDYYHMGVCYRCNGRKVVPYIKPRAQKQVDRSTLPECILVGVGADGQEYGLAVGSRSEMDAQMSRSCYRGQTIRVIANPNRMEAQA
jgi:RecJ-like exonuclease